MGGMARGAVPRYIDCSSNGWLYYDLISMLEAGDLIS